MHFSLYTSQQEPIEQAASYEYYSDGSPKRITLPGGIHQNFYSDPVSRMQWTFTDGVSASEHTVSSTSNNLGRI